jgi:hypothetical protein
VLCYHHGRCKDKHILLFYSSPIGKMMTMACEKLYGHIDNLENISRFKWGRNKRSDNFWTGD